MRENSVILATQSWIFWPSSFFQSNCIRRSYEKVIKVKCFNFTKMSWSHGAEGHGPYDRAGNWGPDKSNIPH